jgi:DNA-binding transcriptional MerR regulator
MRISDLSRRSGAPVATIKFYLREGLLPSGVPTGRNQAEYGDVHIRRLLLIRALTTIGQLDLSSVRLLLAAIVDEELPLPDLYEVASRAMFPVETGDGEQAPEVLLARCDVDKFIDDLNWVVQPDAPARRRLAEVLAALRRLGCECGMEFFAPYAEAAERLAMQELELVPLDGAAADRAAAIVRTVLLEVALGALRRMAQEHYVTERFGREVTTAGEARTGS